MANQLDGSSDKSYMQLARLNAMYGPFPDYVKEASLQESLSPEGLLSNGYADVVGRQFPCHTKAACLLSAAYFVANRSQLETSTAMRVATHLEKAAQQHGIVADIQRIIQREAELVKAGSEESLPDSDFALVKKMGSVSLRRFPLRNGPEVCKAANWLIEYRDHFQFGDRQVIAERILDKSAEHSVSFGENIDYTLNKLAGRGVYNPAHAAEQMRRRSHIFQDPNLKAAMVKLAEMFENSPELAQDPTAVQEMAAAVDAIDKGQGVKYAQLIERPEDVFFAGSLKQASIFIKNACPMATGSIYDHEQLGRLTVPQVRELLGTKWASEIVEGLSVNITKLAGALSGLELAPAVAFDRYMQKMGVAPKHTKASSLQLTSDDRRNLAAEYATLQRAPEPERSLSPSGAR